MAYNNGFPMTYQQMYTPYVQPMSMTQISGNQQSNGSPIWCQGEQAAKSYLTAPNTTVALWDSESQRIYLKSTDASGMPSMKTLEYSIVENGQPQVKVGESYAKQSDLDALRERIDHLYDELEGGK